MPVIKNQGLKAIAAAALAAASFGAAAQTVVYDSLSYPIFVATTSYAQCLDGTCGPGTVNPGPLTSASLGGGVTLTTVGDRIRFDAASTNIMQAFEYGLLVGQNFSGTVNFSSRLELYSSLTNGAVSIDLGAGSFTRPTAFPVTSTEGQNLLIPVTFGTPLDLNGLLGVTGGDVIYTLKLTTTTTPNAGIGILLNDQQAAPPPASTILVGSDVDNTRWLISDTTTPLCAVCDPLLGVQEAEDALSNGFTPAVRFIMAAPIPEPSTYGMMALGLAAVGLMIKRSRRNEA